VKAQEVPCAISRVSARKGKKIQFADKVVNRGIGGSSPISGDSAHVYIRYCEIHSYVEL